MNSRVLIAVFPLMLAVTTYSNAGDKVAMVTHQDAVQITTSSRPAASSSLSSYLVKARKTETKEDFLQKLSKNYPLNYQMLTNLTAADQQAVFAAYKEGERMKSVRKQVISRYAALPAS